MANYKKLPFYQFSGSHYEIGKQFGEACKDLIHKHLQSVFDHLQNNYGASIAKAKETALKYRPYVQKYVPFLDEEIQGIASGADLSLEEAYILQVRAELNYEFEHMNECTSFVVHQDITKDRKTYIGENVDLPEFYSEVGVIIEIVPDDGIPCLMYTFAGQVSYTGINAKGLGVFGNYIACDGWQLGLPRYMYTRLALTTASVDEAYHRLNEVKRSSAQNLIFLDRHGEFVNLEILPSTIGKILPEKSYFVHTNHFLCDRLKEEDRQHGSRLENSHTRLNKMTKLIEQHAGKIDVETLQEMLSNRETLPHCINQMPKDQEEILESNVTEIVTVASIIADPKNGDFWIAAGPSEEYNFVHYRLNTHSS